MKLPIAQIRQGRNRKPERLEVRFLSRKLARTALNIVVILLWSPVLRAQTQPIQYYYDDLGRLVTVVDQSGNVVSYTYDAVGNILSIGRSTVAQGSLAIFDFNPQTGPVGTSVTIRGQGFSPTPSSDTVKFNGSVAAVTSATTTTLVATVPIGATTGPVSVTVASNTATSSTNFTVVPLPVITSVWPKSALFGAVIPNSQVAGANLFGCRFSFSAPGPTLSVVSVNPSGTSATLTLYAGSTAGTYALVAFDPYGANSGTVPTVINRFTVVNPTATADTDGDGYPDVVEAAYGTDPLDPTSHPVPNQLPLVGEADGQPFSVLNTAAANGSPAATFEVDAPAFFSVLNTAPLPGSDAASMEVDATPFSVLNSAAPAGSPSATMEVDAVFFSVQNNASSGNVERKTDTSGTTGSSSSPPSGTGPNKASTRKKNDREYQH